MLIVFWLNECKEKNILPVNQHNLRIFNNCRLPPADIPARVVDCIHGFVILRIINDFTMPRLAVFASGNGSNTQRIAEYFAGHSGISVDLVLSNKPDAYVLTRAEKLGIPSMVFKRESFYGSDSLPAHLLSLNIDYLILAGFLWLIPQNLLDAFPGKIINIHPALLPKYGGKGMFGMKVHEAVIAAKEPESGITIHYVDERYDEGKIIFQSRCPVTGDDTAETLAMKVHALEYRWFPEVIAQVVTDQEEFQG
jgi:phosphoribosylglycinamide formyltransferase-1